MSNEYLDEHFDELMKRIDEMSDEEFEQELISLGINPVRKGDMSFDIDSFIKNDFDYIQFENLFSETEYTGVCITVQTHDPNVYYEYEYYYNENNDEIMYFIDKMFSTRDERYSCAYRLYPPDKYEELDYEIINLLKYLFNNDLLTAY